MAGRASLSSSICFSATGTASEMMASGSMSLGLTRIALLARTRVSVAQVGMTFRIWVNTCWSCSDLFSTLLKARFDGAPRRQKAR